MIRTGALLIVKTDNKIAVHQLTASQQLQLDHQPALETSAREILSTLQLAFTDRAHTATMGQTADLSDAEQAAMVHPRHHVPELTQLPTARMPEFSFPGHYQDGHSAEPVTWRIEPTDPNNDDPARFTIHTIVRTVPIDGFDLQSLKPHQHSSGIEHLPLNTAGELDDCLLRGDLPCTIDIDGQRRQSAMHFAVDRRNRGPEDTATHLLHLSIIIEGKTYAVTDEWFGTGLQRLGRTLPDGVRLVCCATCLYSGYPPSGHGLLGIDCHRSVQAQRSAIRSTTDDWPNPVIEKVPETYLCHEYQYRS